jgi:hypothetical protein
LFLFAEATVAVVTYPEHVAKLRMPELDDVILFQQLGAPPYFLLDVRDFVDYHRGKWTGSGAQSHVRQGRLTSLYGAH